MPAVHMEDEDYNEELIKQRAAMRVEKKFKNFTQAVTAVANLEAGAQPTAEESSIVAKRLV